MAKQNFPFTLAARAHVTAGIEFCTRCVATAKGQLAKAKDQALDITIW
jgi:hypothetical protein